jgi:L-idonate 5-dehydrogenase
VKAVVVYGPGDLRVVERDDPRVEPGEVLVTMEWGGICGSDLSYWKKGMSGTAVLSSPMVLGHEVAGRVAALGAGARGFEIGEPVTIHPATLVGNGGMPERLAGRENLYPEVRYFGSAAFDPHTDGGFSGLRAVAANQVRKLPANVSTRHGAVAEPLGVAIHAVKRAGSVVGKTVLVNGCGPIGALVIAAAKAAGASHVVAADLSSASLLVARGMGADEVCDLSAGDALPRDIEVSFEASGAPAALGAVLSAAARGGTVVQVGNLPAGEVPVSLGDLVSREIDYKGSYRFVDEISDALRMMSEGLDVEPLLSHTFDIDDAAEAFQVAADRSTGSSKVMLKLS